MNSNIREYILNQQIPTLEEFLDNAKEHPILNELILMLNEKLITEKDVVLLGSTLMLVENTQYKMELFAHAMEQTESGKQMGKFTGF